MNPLEIAGIVVGSIVTLWLVAIGFMAVIAYVIKRIF